MTRLLKESKARPEAPPPMIVEPYLWPAGGRQSLTRTYDPW